MSTSSRKSWIVVLVVGLSICLFTVFLGLPGCGSDQSKQDFVDGLLSIIEENQSQQEIAAEGQAAFQAYYQSGFTDLESAATAAESFANSNEKDELSLQELEALEKPDETAQEIADKLNKGIETMDDGNDIYAEELEKAPDQTVEERSQIFAAAGEAMAVYLNGISDIVASFEQLLDYAEKNGLEGQDDIESWYERFQSEKDAIEQSMESMSGS